MSRAFTAVIAGNRYEVAEASQRLTTPAGMTAATITNHDERIILVCPTVTLLDRPAVIAAAVSLAWQDRLSAYGQELERQWATFDAATDCMEADDDAELLCEEAAEAFAAFGRLRQLGVRFDPTFVAQVDAIGRSMRGGETEPDYEREDYHEGEPGCDDDCGCGAECDEQGQWTRDDVEGPDEDIASRETRNPIVRREHSGGAFELPTDWPPLSIKGTKRKAGGKSKCGIRIGSASEVRGAVRRANRRAKDHAKLDAAAAIDGMPKGQLDAATRGTLDEAANALRESSPSGHVDAKPLAKDPPGPGRYPLNPVIERRPYHRFYARFADAQAQADDRAEGLAPSGTAPIATPRTPLAAASFAGFPRLKAETPNPAIHPVETGAAAVDSEMAWLLAHDADVADAESQTIDNAYDPAFGDGDTECADAEIQSIEQGPMPELNDDGEACADAHIQAIEQTAESAGTYDDDCPDRDVQSAESQGIDFSAEDHADDDVQIAESQGIDFTDEDRAFDRYARLPRRSDKSPVPSTPVNEPATHAPTPQDESPSPHFTTNGITKRGHVILECRHCQKKYHTSSGARRHLEIQHHKEWTHGSGLMYWRGHPRMPGQPTIDVLLGLNEPF